VRRCRRLIDGFSAPTKRLIFPPRIVSREESSRLILTLAALSHFGSSTTTRAGQPSGRRTNARERVAVAALRAIW
jgi:hypothetical protein